ncbi:MAG: hypothetical protein WBW33_31820, partial [Bryobacteraceae bacterium]
AAGARSRRPPHWRWRRRPGLARFRRCQGTAGPADLRFKTFNGQVYSDFDVTPMAAPVGQGERRDGKFVYHSHGLQAGRVGQGGAELSFDTLNGNIRLHRAGQGNSSNE